MLITWPRKLSIGDDAAFEPDIFFKFDGESQAEPGIVIGHRVFIGRSCEFNCSKSIVIGNDCLIGSGCKFIDHDHGTNAGDLLMRQLPSKHEPIYIEDDVWFGVNVVVLKGVRIGRGAIIGAGSIVTKSIPSNEIWAGNPAKKIGYRCEKKEQ